MQMKNVLKVLSVLLVLFLIRANLATEKKKTVNQESKVDFARDVLPIFKKNCFSCHGPKKQESNYRLDLKSSALNKADLEELPILVGESGKSPLIQYVSGTHEDEIVMPPEDEGKRLTNHEIRILRNWIDQGANWPDHLAGSKKITTEHWSFQPVAKVVPPQLKNKWITNQIDSFILQKLTQAKLKPAKRASRATLVRRLYLVMHGLPPTEKQISKFVNDQRPDAYHRLVEEVLSSPRYGERWAQHWLDVVRYADTHGFEVNTPRNDAWPYRDYVIRSFNEDKPYNQFVYDQLVGDETNEDAATGFLVTAAALLPGQIGQDEESKKRARQDELHEIIVNTGSTFLGLTIGCARCHNHKFDPIFQKDYYSLQAIFAGVRYGSRKMRLKKNQPLSSDEIVLNKKIDDLRKRYKSQGLIQEAINPVRNVEKFKPIRAKFVRFTAFATNENNRYAPCIDEMCIYRSDKSERKENVALATSGAKATASANSLHSGIHRIEHINDGKYGNGNSWISGEKGKGWVQIELVKPTEIDQIDWGRDRNKKYKDRLAIKYKIEVALLPGQWKTVASSDNRKGGLAQLIKERDRRFKNLTVFAGKFVKPDPTYRLHRGDSKQPREEVAPDTLSVIDTLGMKTSASDFERRSKLAKWMISKKNPFTARVMVNRIWHYHFGTGIVATPSDFGAMGGKPSHPKLLDWLTTEFVKNQWSIKNLHRMILLSSTWRQAGTTSQAGLAIDAKNRLLWRYPVRRIEAEAIRDSILYSSGVLNLKMGGPGYSLFKPNTNYVAGYTPLENYGPKQWRRMIYAHKVRMEKDGVFGALDIPDGGQICPKRSRSTTPIQSLNLFNSSFVIQQAEILAKRVEKEFPKNHQAQIKRIFQLTIGRQPTRTEMQASLPTIKEHGLATLGRVMFNTNEFLFIP